MTDFKNKSILVTGATGLVGSHLTRKLVDMGADVTILVRDYISKSELKRSGYFDKTNRVYGDVSDMKLLERAIGEYEVKIVFHLAAQTIVPIANRNPMSTFDTNIMGTARLLEVCRHAPLIEKIVVASSDKAYGDSGKEAYIETMPLKGEHPYDVSKSSQDLISLAYAHSYDMNIAVARCGNIYGAGDLNWSRLIPGTIRRLLNKERPLIYGNGMMLRDYFYVEDCADAYILLGQSNETGAFNFSGGEPKTALEVVALIQKVMGTKSPLDYVGSSNEIDSQWLDSTKAKERLGFSPAHTLETGLIETVEWYREILK
ncbi:MAG: GDP-mannose 4,6-dehydratase [Candidatus Paceibacterota bacterium]